MDRFDWACVTIITLGVLASMFTTPTRYGWVGMCLTALIMTAHTVFLKMTARSGDEKHG